MVFRNIPCVGAVKQPKRPEMLRVQHDLSIDVRWQGA